MRAEEESRGVTNGAAAHGPRSDTLRGRTRLTPAVVGLSLVMIVASVGGLATLALSNESPATHSGGPTSQSHTALCSCACYGSCGGGCPEGTVTFSSVQVSTTTSGAVFTIVDNVAASITLQWGTTTSYGNTWGPNTEPTSFTISIGSLSAHTTYDYKLSGSASCYNSGSHTGSFTTPYVIYNVATYVFESFGSIQISATSSGAPGSNTYSSGSIASLGVGASYALNCLVASASTIAQDTPVPLSFTNWYSQGGVQIANPYACSTSFTVSGGSGQGAIVMELGYTNQLTPSGGLSPEGGYTYGVPSAEYTEGNVYQVSGTFVLPTASNVSYNSFTVSGTPYTGPEYASLWVGIGGINYWANDNQYAPISLWAVGVTMGYASSTSPLQIYPWFEMWDGVASSPDSFSSAVSMGDTITVSVALQPCNSGVYDAGAYALMDDQTKGVVQSVDYTNPSNSALQGCPNGAIYQPDYHTAEWMVGVGPGYALPEISPSSLTSYPPPAFSQDFQFKSEAVSETAPSSFDAFMSEPIPITDVDFDDGASAIASEITEASLTGMPPYNILVNPINTANGSFTILLD